MGRPKKIAPVSAEQYREVQREAPLFKVDEHGGVKYVRVETPSMGGKSFLIESKGVYVLEEGEGVLRSLSVTYVGSGGVKIYDGLPSDSGHFDAQKFNSDSDQRIRNVNGRPIFTMSPQIIGFWGLDAGFKNGLTVVAAGGQISAPVLVTVVWSKYKGVTPSSDLSIEYGED